MKGIHKKIRKQASGLLSVILSIALVCGVPTTAFSDEIASSSSGDGEEVITLFSESSETSVEVTDITEAWSAGALEITEAGTYVLTADVQTSGTLTLSAPAGETITLDFQGHSVTVQGVVFAGIDVSASLGTVVIKDSAYEEAVAQAEQDGTDVPEGPMASLSVQANKALDAVSGILALYPVVEYEEGTEPPVPSLEIRNIAIDVDLNTIDAASEAAAHDAFGVYVGYEDQTDTRESAPVLIDGCTVSVSLNNIDLSEDDATELLELYGERVLSEGETGVAYGVYASTGTVTLAGAFSSETVSSNVSCDLYSPVENAFVLASTFTPEQTLRIYTAGNSKDVVFATVEDGTVIDDDYLSLFENASDIGMELVLNDGTLRFAAPAQEDVSSGGIASVVTDIAYGAASLLNSIQDGIASLLSQDATTSNAEVILLNSGQGTISLVSNLTDDQLALTDYSLYGDLASWLLDNDLSFLITATGTTGDSVTVNTGFWSYVVSSVLEPIANNGLGNTIIWTDSEGNPLSDWDSDPNNWVYPDGSITLYLTVGFTETEVSVTFESTDPSGNAENDCSVSYTGVVGESIKDETGNAISSFPSLNEPEGWVLLGWSSDGGSTITTSPPTTFPSSDTTYTAVWAQVDGFTPQSLNDYIDAADGGDIDLEPGSYYLEADATLSASQSIILDDLGGYTIDLRGYTLTFGSEDATTINYDQKAIEVSGSAYSVTITDTTAGDGEQGGTIKLLNGPYISVGSLDSAVTNTFSFTMSNVNVMKRYTSSASSLVYLAIKNPAIDLTGYISTAEIENCSISTDLRDSSAGAHASYSTSGYTTYRVTSALSAYRVGTLSIKDSSIYTCSTTLTESSVAQGGYTDAIGVLVKRCSSVLIEDSAIQAVAPSGSAYAVYKDHFHSNNTDGRLELSGDVELTATGASSGGFLSIGAISTNSRRSGSNSTHPSPIVLNGNISFNTEATTKAYALAADLSYSTASEALFEIGADFSTDTPLTCISGLTYSYGSLSESAAGMYWPYRPTAVSTSANSVGTYFASFADGVSDDQKETLVAYLANGITGSSVALGVSSEGDGAQFSLEALAFTEATIVRDGDTIGYSTFESAARDARSGETIQLAANLNREIEFAEALDEGFGSGSLSYIVDLNGYSIGKFTCSSDANVTLVDSSEGKSSVIGATATTKVSSLGTALVGIEQAGSGTLTLSGITVDLAGSATNAYGIVVSSGSVELVGTSLSVNVSGGDAYGVRAVGAGANASLSGCTVSISGSEGQEVWTASMEASSDEACGTLTLSGTSTFELFGESGARISHDGTAIAVASDFSLVGEGVVSVRSANLTTQDDNNNDIFASLFGSSGSLENMSSLFVAFDDASSEYRDCEVVASEGSLAWSSSGNVAQVGSEEYETFASALAAALKEESSADNPVEITLLDDAYISSLSLTFGEHISINLNGNDLDVVSSSTSGSQLRTFTYGIQLQTGSSLTLKDSSTNDGSTGGISALEAFNTANENTEGGILSITVNPTSAQNFFYPEGANEERSIGIRVADSSSLTLVSGVAVEVVYGGASNVSSIVGVWAAGTAQVSLQEGSSLTVSNASSAGTLLTSSLSGAERVYGIWNGTSSGGSITVAKGAAISVSNAGGVTASHASETPAQLITTYIREFDVTEDSALYQAICADFYANAAYDSSVGIYYVAGRSISGTYYWAVSDPMTGDDTDNNDYFVPAKIYVLSDWQASPDAIGIGGDSDAAGSVTISGTVSATSEHGNAYALRPADSSSWLVDGATLSATTNASETDAYLMLTNASPDLSEELGIDVSELFAWTQLVVETVPQAAAIAGRTSYAAVALAGESNYSVSGEKAAHILIDTAVEIESGFISENALSIANTSGETELGASFAVTAESSGVNLSNYVSTFVDATGSYVPGLSTDGDALVWAEGSYREPGETVTLTFTGVRGQGLGDDATLAVESGVALSENVGFNVSIYQLSDYGMLKFVGWAVSVSDIWSGSGTVMRVIDPEDLGNFVPDGDATLTAYYVAVGGSQSLVAFKERDYVFAYAVDVGARPTYAEAYAATMSAIGGSTVSAPDEPASWTDEGDTWTFDGWYAGYCDLPEPDSTLEGQELVAVFEVELPDDGSQEIWYTAHFAQSVNRVTVTLSYYVDSSIYGGWTRVERDFSVPYGTNIATAGTDGWPSSATDITLRDFANEESSGWRVHRLIGWSTREGATQGLGELLPAVSELITYYYAVYSDEDLEATVSFMVPDENGDYKVGMETTVSANATLATALDGWEPEAPEGMVFVGWSVAQDSTATLNESAAVIGSTASFEAPAEVASNLNEKTVLLGTATYYAVFAEAEAESVAVSMYPGDDAIWNVTATEFAVLQGETIFGTSSGSYTNPYRSGYVFVGWYTAETGGELFDLENDPVVGSESSEGDGLVLELWARYVAIASQSFGGASIDASGVYVNDDVAEQVTSSLTIIAPEDTASSEISIGDYEEALSVWTFSFLAQTASGTVDLTESFGGELTVTLPISADYADRDGSFVVYLAGVSNPVSATLDSASGTVSFSASAALSSASDTVSFSLTAGLSSTAGNIVLVYQPSTEELELIEAKEGFVEQLEGIFASYDETNYSEANWALIRQALTDGLADVEAATTVAEGLQAAQDASDAMAAVSTVAEELGALQSELGSRLQAIFDTYSEDDYYEADWNTMIYQLDGAHTNIGEAATEEAAWEAFNDAIEALAAVPTKVEQDSSTSNSSGTSGSSGGNTSGLTSSTTTSLTSSGSGLTSTGSGLTSTSSGLTSTSSSGLTSTTSDSSSGLTSTALSGLSSAGSTSESMLGATLETLDADLAEEYGTTVTSGVYVSAVDDDGPADEAGIQAGDVIVAIDGQEISTVEELDEYLAELEAGDVVEIEVNRDGEALTFSVTLDEASSLGLTSTSLSSGDGTTALSSSEDEPTGLAAVAAWLREHIVPVVIGLLVLAAAIAGLVWWLLRRRKSRFDEEELDEHASDDDAADEDSDFWSSDFTGGAAGSQAMRPVF